MHVCAANTERLLELARDWMPRYGAEVKTLLFTWWTSADLRGLQRESNTPKIQQVLTAAERLTGLRTLSANPVLRTFVLHDALIARILHACSGLRDLRVIQVRAATLDYKGDDGTKTPIVSSRTASALQRVRSRISSADLSLGGATRPADFQAIEDLNILSHIKHLGLRRSGFAYNHVFPDLSPEGFPLQQLVSLELNLDRFDAPVLQERLLQFPSRLTQLRLSGLRNLDLRQLALVLKAQPFASLSLRDFAVSLLQAPNYIPDDLSVENLSISGCPTSILLEFFNSAPLKNVEFCARRQEGVVLTSGDLIKAFVEKHRASLLSVKIDRALLGWSVDVSEINRSLEEEGISVRVVTVG